MNLDWVAAGIGAGITLTTVTITQLLVWLFATMRERATLRATKAAEAFVEFYDAMNESRTVRDFLEWDGAATHAEYDYYQKQSIVLLNRINRCRAMLAAVLPPEAVRTLADIENDGGFYPSNLKSRTALTNVAHSIRAGVGAGRVKDKDSLNTLLFGRLQDHRDRDETDAPDDCHSTS